MIIEKLAELPSEVPLETDVAVIGAGVSGLYCAWRLLQADPGRRVTVVERLNRTGGRLDTDIVEIAPGEEVREEQGGMRFNYGMTELMRLNAALDLCSQIVPFPMSSPENTNRYFVRGRGFSVADAASGGERIWRKLYRLREAETGLSPTDIVTTTFDAVLTANGIAPEADLPPDFWTRLRQEVVWDGTPMKDWQLWGLLRRMGYSEECVDMLSQTIGFAGPFRSMANAGDAFQILADFPKDPRYFTFKRGFSSLPDALVAKLERHGDAARILTSTNVDSISGDDGDFTVTLTVASGERNSRPSIPGGAVWALRAKTLVVAVATKGMEDLFHRSPALRDHPDGAKLWDAIHSVLGMTLMKINLYFDSPWWQNGLSGRPSVEFGPNFSDLPVNAVYPFYALPEHVAAAKRKNPAIRNAAAALTIYCDFEKTDFWHGLQTVGPLFASPLQERESARRPQRIYAATDAVVEAAREQLGALFGMTPVPRPVLTSYRLWNGQDDFEFAYHQWRLGANDPAVRAYLSQPWPGIHFCNEAISDMHGWVNGSLRSTDLALEHFGLTPLSDAPCPPQPELTATVTRRMSGLWGG